MKIAVVGMGRIGGTIAFSLTSKSLGKHLVVANRNLTKAQGDALDLHHAQSFCSKPMQITACTIDQVEHCDILIITTSVPTPKNVTSRLELAKENIKLFSSLIPDLSRKNPNAIIIVISNPVEVLTYLTTQLSGFSSNRVLGIGTLVDSARFRALLSAKENIHPDDLRTYILGEHGENQFPVFSNARAGTEPIDDNPEHREIFNRVNSAGFEVYKLKGYTNFAIALATSEVIRIIINDEYRTLPICTHFKQWQGIEDNCFSIPVVLNRQGIVRYLQPQLNQREQQHLKQTAKVIKGHIETLLPSYFNC